MTVYKTPYLQSGDRVEYAMTSGFCTQIYWGRVIKVGDVKSLIDFGSYGESWVENHYLHKYRERS